MKLTLNATNVYCIMLMAILAFGGCSNDDEAMPQHKGATTQLMQNIADHVPYIQEVLNEKIHKISDGVNITEVSFTYCTKQTHMFIAEINLTQNVTIVTSTPDNQMSMGNLKQTVTEQIEKAVADGVNVLLGINGHSGGICYKNAQELKSTFGRDSEQVFYLLDDGKAYITTVPEFNLHRNRVANAISGSHSLLIDGEVGQFIVDDGAMSFSPRTFVGVTKEHDKVYFFIVDGGQDEYSNGMRLEDIMLVCQGAGCYQAMDLEGNEASTIVCKTEGDDFLLMNKPSSGTEIPVANGLQVIVKNN